MNAKVLLAMGLDALKKGETLQRDADQLQAKVAHGPSPKDFHCVKRAYNQAYDQLIRGLQIINFCRTNAIDVGDVQLSVFCADKMAAYMDRCEGIRDRETNILMSVEQADRFGGTVDKAGFVLGETIYHRSPRQPVVAGSPIVFESEEIAAGSYHLSIKNYDDYSMAAPVVTIELSISSRGGGQRMRKVIPGRCAWGRYFGCVQAAKMKLVVSSDAWVRKSSVEVMLVALVPTEPEPGSATLFRGNSTVELPALPPLPPGLQQLAADLNGASTAPAPASAAAVPLGVPPPPVVGTVVAEPIGLPPPPVASPSSSKESAPLPPPPGAAAAAAAPPPTYSVHTAAEVLPPDATIEERLHALTAILAAWPSTAAGSHGHAMRYDAVNGPLVERVMRLPEPTAITEHLDVGEMHVDLDDMVFS